MVLAKELKTLQEMKETKLGVLSIYLSTSPDMRDQWKIVLKNEFKEIHAMLSESTSHDELKSFTKVRDMVDRALSDSRGVVQRSIIVFASEEDKLFEVHYLPIDVISEVHWSPKPKLHQLEQLQKEYPNVGIILTNKGAITILNTLLGEVDEELRYELDIDTNDWKKYQGRAARSRVAAGSSQQEKFQKRMDANLENYYREIAQEVKDMKSRWDWKEVILIGESDQANFFASALDKKPEKIIYKNLKKASHQEILHTVFNQGK